MRNDVHVTYVRGLFTKALEYSQARDSTQSREAARRLLATSYRHAASKLRETNEGGGVPDGATLLEQLADEVDPDSLLVQRTTKDLAER